MTSQRRRLAGVRGTAVGARRRSGLERPLAGRGAGATRPRWCRRPNGSAITGCGTPSTTICRGSPAPRPDVLIANAGARTSRIRLGSGGVMLPNHAPLVVAERFGTLEALFPGRIDLGIGRAPGTDQRTARRAAPAGRQRRPPRAAARAVRLLRGVRAAGEDYRGIRAIPGYGGDLPAIWLLGSSGFSAQVAGALGLPFAFAHHFSAHNTRARARPLPRALPAVGDPGQALPDGDRDGGVRARR